MSNKKRNDISELPRFFEAAARNDLDTVKVFIEEKHTPISMATFGDRETVAHIAAKNGHLDIIRYMVKKKPSIIYEADALGNTVLFLAIEKGALDIVKFLIEECKEKVFQRHRTLLERTTINVAIEYDHMHILKYFLEERGADVNSYNNMREPPVFTALNLRRHKIFKYLVEERNANLTLVDVHNDNILFRTVPSNDLAAMKYILDERKIPFDINWKNEYGDTLVHRACTLERFGILKYVVEEKQADIHAREMENMTALHIAAFKNNYEICHYLIERGADVRALDNFGKRPTDKVSDTRLKEYMKNIPAPRSRRSVLRSSYYAGVPAFQPVPRFPCVQLVDQSSGMNTATSVRNIFNISVWSNTVHSFLFSILTMALIRRPQQWGSEDTRLDPVAIDVIDSIRYTGQQTHAENVVRRGTKDRKEEEITTIQQYF